MDGNGRWARKKGMLRLEGHRAGIASVKTVIRSCIKHDISILSLFAFSSENWQRPAEEVDFLMSLFLDALKKEVTKLSEQGVRLLFSGDRSLLSPQLQSQMLESETQTQHNRSLTLNVMVNYGGKWDITQAVKTMALRIQSGSLQPEAVTEAELSKHLNRAQLPDPDLFIRTSGEYRISNFFLWQLAYTELYFTDVLWPDFDECEFDKALHSFANRKRRYGSVSKESTE
jgi:undecaprenyl diphosphate synthase